MNSVTLCLILFISLPSLTFASPITVEALTDKTDIKMGERLTLTIKISGEVAGSFPSPSVPGHDGFDIIGAPLQSSSFSWINGRVSSTKTISYTLIPHSTGTFSIGRATINYRGDTYSTNPVEVTVGKAPEPAPEDEEETVPRVSADPYGRIMVSASLDKNVAYIGEALVYTFSFFRKVRLWEAPQYYPPDFTDFWVEDLPRDSRTREVVIKGERYIREDIKKVLFPTREGYFTIKSTTINAQIDPFGRPIVLTTDPLELEVLPFPIEPADFSGAVGSFAITATADREKVKEGEPVTVKVELAGAGNIKALPQPVFEDSEDFRRYEPKDSVEISTLNDMISGTKTFEYLFIPLRSGDMKLPSFSFTFFDPLDEEFETVSSKEIHIEVDAAKRGEGPQARMEPSPATAAEKTDDQLRPIRTKSDLDNWNPGAYVSGIYPWLIILPPILLFSVILVKGISKRSKKSKSALKKALTSLKGAEGLIAEENYREFFSETASSLYNYLLDSLHLPGSAASRDELLRILAEARCPKEHIERIGKTFNTADIGRFSPTRYGRKEMTDFLHEVEDIIKTCEKLKIKRGQK